MLQQPFSLPAFIESWITFYVDLFADSSRALVQLRMMILEDEEINHHFSDFEAAYFLKIVGLLNRNGIALENLFEKVYASCILVNAHSLA